MRQATAVRARLRAVRIFIFAATFCLAGVMVPAGVRSETLVEALLSAYRLNPRLDGERARLRAIDENVARAQSGYRPRLEANGFAGPRKYDESPTLFADEDVDVKGYQLTVSQPLFRGFRTVNSVRQAEAVSASGQENLKTAEARTFLAAVTAYADTLRDQAVLALRRANIQALAGEVTAARARLAAEDATRADVAQAEARTARAEADAETAEASLNASQASFEEVIGYRPGALNVPGNIFAAMLPPSREAAVSHGIEASPVVLAAVHREEAAQHAVNAVLGEMLPEVSVEGAWNQTFDPEPGLDRLEEGYVVGRVRMPLYQGGDVSARVRQAKQEQQAAVQDVRAARLAVQTSVVAAWARLNAARARVQSNETQIRAAKTAVKSVREEQKIGARTVLDVLNAQQELVDAQAALAVAKRDELVMRFEVLAETGLLTMANLGIADAVYQPQAHLDDVRGKWIGTDVADEAPRADVTGIEISLDDGSASAIQGSLPEQGGQQAQADVQKIAVEEHHETAAGHFAVLRARSQRRALTKLASPAAPVKSKKGSSDKINVLSKTQKSKGANNSQLALKPSL